MAQVIRFERTGGPEVLQLEEMDVGEPGPGEVLLQQKAAGLNFADTYFRRGIYPVPLPSGIGVEAAGVVAAVGEGVDNVAVGDRVTYTGFTDTLGAYCSARLIAASALIPLPEGMDFETAACSTMRGLTAAYLLRRIHPFQGHETVLLHAAAGGLGLILTQWARLLGLTVIGTVSSAAKAEVALAYGCNHVIDYVHEDVAQRVREITRGAGVAVVFDGVGKDTFMDSIDSLQRRGLLVCVGTASGAVAPFDPALLARKGSLFVTRPALADYLCDPREKQALVAELFGHLAAGRIRVEIHRRYALAEAAQAHRDLEGRQTVGASVFIL